MPQAQTKIVSVDGQLIQVPADATPEQIDQISKATKPAPVVGVHESKIGPTPPWYSKAGLKSIMYGDVLPPILGSLPTVGAAAGGAIGAGSGTFGAGPVGTAAGGTVGTALGGAAGKSLENNLRRALGYDAPHTMGAEVKQLITEAETQTLAAQLGEAGSQWLVKTTKNPQVAKWIQDYWHSRGVNLSAGERVPNSLIGAVEPMAAKMPSTKGPVMSKMAERQAVLTKTAGELAERVGPTGSHLPLEVNQAIDRSVDRLTSDINKAMQYTGRAAAGTSADVNTNILADTVEGALKDTHKAQDALETELYNASEGEAREYGYKMKNGYDNAATRFAEDEAHKAAASGRIASSHLEPTTIERLRTASRIADKNAAAQKLFPDDPDLTFDSLGADEQQLVLGWLRENKPVGVADTIKALSGINHDLQQLYARGLYDDANVGALQKLKSLLRAEVMEQAPANIASNLEAAYAITTAQKSQFNNAILRKIMTIKNPPTRAFIVNSLLKRGDGDLAESLLNILPENDPAWPIIRKGTVDWIAKTANNDPERMLRLVDNTPAVKKVLGSNYNAYRAQLEATMRWFTQPERQGYLSWLEKVRGEKNPEGLIDRLAGSQADRQYLDAAIQHGGADSVAEARLLGVPTKDQLRANVARDALNRALDQSTSAEGSKAAYVTFGQPGSYFDPIAFYNNFQKYRSVLQQFGDPQVVRDLAEFAEAGKALRLSHNMAPSNSGNMSATWYAIMTLMRGGAAMGALATGHPILAAGAAESIWMPRHFIELAMSKKGAALLAEGSRISAADIFGRSAVGAKWLIRFTDALMEASNNKRKPQTQPQPQPVGVQQ